MHVRMLPYTNFLMGDLRDVQAVDFSAYVRIIVRVHAPTSQSAFHMAIFIDLPLTPCLGPKSRARLTVDLP